VPTFCPGRADLLHRDSAEHVRALGHDRRGSGGDEDWARRPVPQVCRGHLG
jgi:hypothetical protein